MDASAKFEVQYGLIEELEISFCCYRDMGLDPSLDTFTSLACAYAEKGDVDNIKLVR